MVSQHSTGTLKIPDAVRKESGMEFLMLWSVPLSVLGAPVESYVMFDRPSDRVWEKNGNCALFWRRIVRDKKLIVQDCAIFSCNINVKFLL